MATEDRIEKGKTRVSSIPLESSPFLMNQAAYFSQPPEDTYLISLFP